MFELNELWLFVLVDCKARTGRILMLVKFFIEYVICDICVVVFVYCCSNLVDCKVGAVLNINVD